MAKMERSKVVLKDLEKGVQYEIEAEQTPRKTEAGVYLYLKINQLGVQHLQSKGLMLRSTKDLERMFCKSTEMPEAGIGSLGNWKKEEDREKFPVEINELNWVPTVKQTEETPTTEPPKEPTEVPVVVAPTVAIADKTEAPVEAKKETSGDIITATVGKIVELISKGTHTAEQIKGAYEQKYGAERTALIWTRVQEALTPKVGPQEADIPSIDFSI